MTSFTEILLTKMRKAGIADNHRAGEQWIFVSNDKQLEAFAEAVAAPAFIVLEHGLRTALKLRGMSHASATAIVQSPAVEEWLRSISKRGSCEHH